MNTLEINTQEELNNIDINFKGYINIIGKLDVINKHYHNAIISIYGNATVKYVSGNATVTNVSGNATVTNVSGNATVSNVYDNATVSNVYDNATVSNVYGNTTVKNVSGNATVKYVSGNATVKYVSGNATVTNVSDNATVTNVSGNATVTNVSGNATVLFIDNNVKVETLGNNIVSYYNDKNVKLECLKGTTVVILSRFEPTFKGYSETYPMEVKGDKVILYKTVHKTLDGKYLANYNMLFEYKINEFSEEKCDIDINNECSYGIHISHKMWALKFGTWDNVALLELEVDINDIIIPKACGGKVRTSKAKVLREVPEIEWYL